MATTKKYRVNASERFNLVSMYEKAKCWEIDCIDGIRNDWDFVESFIDELEKLMEKAPCVGSLVDWPTLKRIREIRDERCLIRYQIALKNGADHKEARNAFI